MPVRKLPEVEERITPKDKGKSARHRASNPAVRLENFMNLGVQYTKQTQL